MQDNLQDKVGVQLLTFFFGTSSSFDASCRAPIRQMLLRQGCSFCRPSISERKAFMKTKERSSGSSAILVLLTVLQLLWDHWQICFRFIAGLAAPVMREIRVGLGSSCQEGRFRKTLQESLRASFSQTNRLKESIKDQSVSLASTEFR